jgi:hypothetical protein
VVSQLGKCGPSNGPSTSKVLSGSGGLVVVGSCLRVFVDKVNFGCGNRVNHDGRDQVDDEDDDDDDADGDDDGDDSVSVSVGVGVGITKGPVPSANVDVSAWSIV